MGKEAEANEVSKRLVTLRDHRFLRKQKLQFFKIMMEEDKDKNELQATEKKDKESRPPNETIETQVQEPNPTVESTGKVAIEEQDRDRDKDTEEKPEHLPKEPKDKDPSPTIETNGKAKDWKTGVRTKMIYVVIALLFVLLSYLVQKWNHDA